jgi:hypothetical protein
VRARAAAAESLVDQFRTERAADIARFRALAPAQLARTGQHDEVGSISVANLLNYWPNHELTHLRQAAAAIRARLLPAAGPIAVYAEEV